MRQENSPPETKLSRISFDYTEDLLFAGARQQYILGLQFAKLHPAIFGSESVSGFKFISSSNLAALISSQSMARGVLAYTKGTNLSNSNPNTVRPPGNYPTDKDSGSNQAVPPGINLQSTTTFENEEDLVLANYSSACNTVDHDLNKMNTHFISTQTNLLRKFGEGISDFAQIEKIYLGMQSAYVRSNGVFPPSSELEEITMDAWARGAALSYLGALAQHTEQIVRLITSQIFTRIEGTKNSSMAKTSETGVVSPRATFLHVTAEQFLYSLALLNLTSRDCLTQDLETYFKTPVPSRANFTWSKKCQPYPLPSSAITVSLHPNPSLDYNGISIPIPSPSGGSSTTPSLSDLLLSLSSSLMNKNLDYYCILDPSSQTFSSDFYLLVYMILAVFFLLASISIYFITITRAKQDLVEHQFQKIQKLSGALANSDSQSVRSMYGTSVVPNRRYYEQRLLNAQSDF